MQFSKSLQGSKSAISMRRFNRIDFAPIPSYKELPCSIRTLSIPVGIYLLKVNTNGVVLVSLLLTLNIFHTLL